MNQTSARSLTLYDLLSRRWQCAAAVAGITISADQSTVAFALNNGDIALAGLADDDPAHARIRMSADVGRATIRPRERPTAELSVVAAGRAAVPVAAGGGARFAVGDASGAVSWLGGVGDAAGVLLAVDGPVAALDCHPTTEAVAAAGDGDVVVSQGGVTRSTGIRGHALAFSPDGGRLAIASADSVAIWDGRAPERPASVFDVGAGARSLRWSADGGQLACALERAGLGLIDCVDGSSTVIGNFPRPVRSVDWSEAGAAVVAAGAFRIAAWRRPARPCRGNDVTALETGSPGMVPVERVAAHPRRDLVAAGYANGLIVVARLGLRDELVLRAAGGAVTALLWSADGRHLVVGDDRGEAAIVGLPPQIFK